MREPPPEPPKNDETVNDAGQGMLEEPPPEQPKGNHALQEQVQGLILELQQLQVMQEL